MSGWNSIVDIRRRENHIGKEYYGLMKPKLSYLDVILEIMHGGKLAMLSNQRTQFQQWNLEVAAL